MTSPEETPQGKQGHMSPAKQLVMILGMLAIFIALLFFGGKSFYHILSTTGEQTVDYLEGPTTPKEQQAYIHEHFTKDRQVTYTVTEKNTGRAGITAKRESYLTLKPVSNKETGKSVAMIVPTRTFDRLAVGDELLVYYDDTNNGHKYYAASEQDELLKLLSN